jgi:cell division protein FtsI (penicillin-binding protein 3)
MSARGLMPSLGLASLGLNRSRRRGQTPTDLPGRPPLVRLEGAAKIAIETARTRLVIAGMLFLLAFGVLASRVVELTWIRSADENSIARTSVHHTRVITQRRSIVDRNGQLLAVNIRTTSLYAKPKRVLEPAKAAAMVVAVLPELSQAEVYAKLTSGKSFVWLKRNLTPRQQDAVNRLGIPGLYFQNEQRRIYPQGRLAPHVVGFTDIDNRGLAGIEQFFDESLRDPIHADEPLEMALDIRVQHALRDELQRGIQEFSAVAGAGLVMDVATGEVLAMVSLPDFDPMSASDAGDDARFNRMTLGVFEMGSAMKTLTTAMALETGAVTLASGYDATKPIHVSRYTISDYKPKNRWLSVPEIFKYSSNIGTAKMALDIGTARQRDYLGRFGMLRKPTIELPEVGAPLIPAQWKTLETMTISYGHGLSVSPLQLATAMAAVVNGGILRNPTLLRRSAGQSVAGAAVIGAQTSDAMRRLLHLAVEEGTGKNASVNGYLVGGKTGTSEKISEYGRYNRKALLNTFVGAFPINAPRYVILATMDEPKANKSSFGYATAGWTVAPVVGRTVARIAPMLGIAPVDENSADIQQALYIGVGQNPERHLAAN